MDIFNMTYKDSSFDTILDKGRSYVRETDQLTNFLQVPWMQFFQRTQPRIVRILEIYSKKLSVF